MLPNFTLLRKDVNKSLQQVFEESRLASSPLLANIGYVIQHEGTENSFQTVEGDVKSLEYQKFSIELKVTVENVLEKGFDFVIEKFAEAGKEAGAQMSTHSYQEIGRVIEEAGNSIDAGGRPISKELFYELIDRMVIDFDDDTGKPNMPSVHIHPNQADAWKVAIDDAKASPEFEAKFTKMLERKKEEWHAREADRKLVD